MDFAHLLELITEEGISVARECLILGFGYWLSNRNKK